MDHGGTAERDQSAFDRRNGFIPDVPFDGYALCQTDGGQLLQLVG